MELVNSQTNRGVIVASKLHILMATSVRHNASLSDCLEVRVMEGYKKISAWLECRERNVVRHINHKGQKKLV